MMNKTIPVFDEAGNYIKAIPHRVARGEKYDIM